MPAGHCRQTTLTGNARKSLVFDALWRPVVEQNLDLGTGQMTETMRRYDLDGNATFESHPMNSSGQAVYSDTSIKGTRTSYDALDRPVTVQQDWEFASPIETKYEYLAGFQTRVTNPLGKATTTSFYTWDTPTTDYPRDYIHPEDALLEQKVWPSTIGSYQATGIGSRSVAERAAVRWSFSISSATWERDPGAASWMPRDCSWLPQALDSTRNRGHPTYVRELAEPWGWVRFDE